MTSPFASASLTYASGRVTFHGATGLKMPFSGAVVVPRPGGETPALDLMSAQQSLFVPLRFPKSGPGGTRMFPSLRTMDGTRLSLRDPVLIFVAEDPGVFDEFDLREIFSEGAVLTPQFPETGTLTSSRPKYLVLKLDGAAQPTDANPRLLEEGQDLSTIVGGLPGSLSGTLIAFDYAGLEIEADAALATLGETNVSGAPGGNDVRVQFVDILGKPLGKDALFGLELDPAPQDQEPARMLYKLSFPGTDRTFKIRITDPIPARVNDDDKYLWRNIKVAVWPGREARLIPVYDTEPDLNLTAGATAPPPPFLRLCVFHPCQTMQDEYGGLLDQNARFTRDKGSTPANGFSLSSEADDVELFNDGESYLRNFYDVIDAAGAGSKLYINNWSTHAHLHMRGTLSRMGLGPVDLEGGEVETNLEMIDQNRIMVKVGTDGKGFLVLPDQLDRVNTLQEGFQFEIRRVPAPGLADKELAKGFFRPGGILSFPMSGDNDVPFPSRVIARWKNLAGETQTTEHTIGTGIAPLAPGGLGQNALALGITADDPPSGTVIRKMDMTTLRGTIGGVADHLWLLVVNTTTGRHIVHNLTPSPAATDVLLGTLPDDTSATDMLYALVLNASPGPADTLANLVVSGAVRLKYTTAQHAAGDIPLAREELGGLLRRAIARGVEVRAIYWDQFLANLGSGDELDSGHKNNEELTAIINANRNGKRGWAVRDRSTRAFGSFHQKGIVFMRGIPIEATAWLGGIDLALGRWDTEFHLESDPDRQSSKWWDVQVRLTGPAAVEVLRNFSQRWRAIGEFIKDPNTFHSCVPINPTPAIQQYTAEVIKLPPERSLFRGPNPVANVQITRTCPPHSCHGEIPKATAFGLGTDPLGEIARDGELGSLASYLKAIAMARRFILINDQYFFSPEIALALHKALSSPDGPSGLVLMLPLDLGEDPRIDPMLFMVRQKSLHILFHGGTYSPPPTPTGVTLPNIRKPHCGHITANLVDANSSVAAKTAVLFARNRSGGKVYVHSKTMIVDDVWMSVGSANLNYRSTTYDFEINAGIVGDKIDFGGTDVVRRQRIELARRMLGMPAAYAPMIADPEVMFTHFKALEGKKDSPKHTLHPLDPMSQKLDPTYVKRVGDDEAFDKNVDIVAKLRMDDPLIDGIACTITDPDGRSEQEALAPFAGILGNSTRAYARIILTVGCQTLVYNLINGGSAVFAEIRVTEGQASPRRAHLVPLELSGTTVVPSPSRGELYVPLSTGETVEIEARIIDATDTPQGCAATVTIDPNLTLVLSGSLHNVTLNMT